MTKKQNCDRALISFTSVATLVLLANAIPSTPAFATHDNDYEFCAKYLLKAGISPEPASTACAQALNPNQLTECVFTIQKRTPVAATDALPACVRVRRPVDLSTCVIDINKHTKEPVPLAVLDYCRRSLLPKRFSECVIGLSKEIDFTPNNAMETCISAYDWPRNLSPTFVPSGKPPASQMKSTPSTPTGGNR